MRQYLEGRVAIITGGFTGIGRAIAIALAERGATIAIGARRQPEAAIEAIEAVTKSFYYRSLDVCNVDSVTAFVAELEQKHGPADILVNSAGISTHENICGHDEQTWMEVIDTNLSGPFRMTRACLPAMIAQGWGRIIHIGSTAARTATADHAAYCASKSGLLGLSRAVALEGAPYGVSSIVISPTWVQTEMFDKSMKVQAQRAGHGVDEEIGKLVEQSPQKRLLQPRELGALAAFLCHEDALGITMEDIQVNAGSFW